MRRSRIVTAVFLAAAVFVSLGMGDLGVEADKTPRAPKQDFTGTVTDRSMNTLAVSHMHCEGKTSIKGYLGEIRVTLDFKNVESVVFAAAAAGGFTPGTVALRDGQIKSMRFKNLTRCYGQTDLGHMMVRVKDLRSIRFDEPPAPETGDE
ncbi:MAG: hypothetical protein P9L99_00575 [Candidatus Lernaella stagnicola]|nr:hypothetical protein [Candidatus Lernaella stagnicola]